MHNEQRQTLNRRLDFNYDGHLGILFALIDGRNTQFATVNRLCDRIQFGEKSEADRGIEEARRTSICQSGEMREKRDE